jgi:hypothetical protein
MYKEISHKESNEMPSEVHHLSKMCSLTGYRSARIQNEEVTIEYKVVNAPPELRTRCLI